jgi:hypothetical protein
MHNPLCSTGNIVYWTPVDTGGGIMPQGCGCGTGGGGGSTADVQAVVAGMVTNTPCLHVTGAAGSQQLAPVISNQSGNLLSCTSNGLYVAGQVTPTFCAPADLPTPFYIANAQGPYAPWGSRAYLDVCLEHGIDGIFNYVWPAPDGPFLWGINSATSTSNRYLSNGYTTRVWQPPIDPTGRHGEIDSQTWVNAISPAGNATGLMPNSQTEITYNAAVMDTPDGGWWGWGASPYSPMTLRMALDYNACRMRFFTNMEGTTFHSGSSNIANRFVADMADTGYAPAVIPCINWSLTSANGIYTGAGYQTAALVTSAFTGTGQDLLDDGFTYAIVNPDAIDPAIVESLFTTEGLIGIANQGMSRHYKTAANLAAGAQGIISHDPVYSRGHTGADADTLYEKDRQHYDYNRTIGSSTERGDVNTGNAYQGRPGRHLYVPSPTTTVANSQRELLVPLDIPDPTNFELNWTMAWDTAALSTSNQIIGIFFGNTQDSTTWPPRATTAELAALNGYLCTVRISLNSTRGNIYVVKYTAGVAQQLYLANHNLTGPDGYLHMGLQVSPSSFRIVAYNDAWTDIGGPTINDPDYRGKYVWAVIATASGTDSPISSRFTNINVGAPNAAGLLSAEEFAELAPMGLVGGDEAEGDGTSGVDELESLPLVAPVDPAPIFNDPRPNPLP